MGIFFFNGDFLSGIFSDFFRTALFLEKLLLHISLTNSTQLLLSQSIYFFRASAFFRELRFRKDHFLTAVIFSEYLISRNEASTEQPLCENRKFFREVTFQKSYFFGGLIELLRVKYLQKSSFDRSRYFCTASAFSEELHFRKSCF